MVASSILSGSVISISWNTLVPVGNLKFAVEGIKNEPSTVPLASVIRDEEPSG